MYLFHEYGPLVLSLFSLMSLTIGLWQETDSGSQIFFFTIGALLIVGAIIWHVAPIGTNDPDE